MPADGSDHDIPGWCRLAAAGRSARGDRWLLLAVALILGIGVVAVLDLTLIPRGLDDRAVGVVPSNDGPEYVTVYTHESGALPTYAVVVERAGGPKVVRREQRLVKRPWSTSLRVGARDVDLMPPRILYEYLGALTLLVGVGVLRWSRRPRAGPG